MHCDQDHRVDFLVLAWPKAAPGLPRHSALHASTLYYFARAETTTYGPFHRVTLAESKGLKATRAESRGRALHCETPGWMMN